MVRLVVFGYIPYPKGVSVLIWVGLGWVGWGLIEWVVWMVV